MHDAMAWTHNYKPPRGEPANGAGWAGEAQGSTYKPPRAWDARSAEQARAAIGTVTDEEREYRAARVAELEASREARMRVYLEVAADEGQSGSHRVMAITEHFNRVEGKAAQHVTLDSKQALTVSYQNILRLSEDALLEIEDIMADTEPMEMIEGARRNADGSDIEQENADG